MRFVTILSILTLGIHLSAATNNLKNGDLFQGEEQINEQATGQACYLYVDYVDVNPIGKYCYNLTTRPVFTTDRSLHPQDEIIVMGHITNFHRPEYPKIKTCAMSLDGKTSGHDIYADNTDQIYNQLFSWAGKHNGSEFDFFVTLSAKTKLPSRTRLHKLNAMSETNYDCIKLRKLN